MTNSALSSDPSPGGKCRVCGSELPESLRCSTCGAAYGEGHRCPHCQSVAGTEPDGLLRQRCRVCGGPRVAIEDKSVVRSGREIKYLEEAQKERVRRAVLLASSGVVGGFGVLSVVVTLLVLLVASPGLIGTLAMLGAVSIPLVVSALAWMRARKHQNALDTALDRAWALAAEDVMLAKGKDLTAAELAKILRMEESEAESLLAELSASDVVQSQITSGGDVTYAPSTRVRVEANERESEKSDAEADASEDEDEAQVRARARAEREN